MPAVSVQCPHCSRSYSIDGSLMGRKARCKHCGNAFALTPSGEHPGHASASGNEPASGVAPSSWSPGIPLPEQIGRFLIKERLGAGACGTVYRAFDPTLDREVALKVPHPEFQRDEKAVSRFLREAKAAAKLHHPYIVTVFEAGTDGETSYIASAFITGRSLAAATADGPFEPRRAARIIAALADALHAAHQPGIIHRDVKPANVLLDADDWPHLADFGLARLAAGGAKLTKVGSILGTPAYLAPEQAQGKSDQAEPASDQYSLGATFYELLCGEVPFAGPLEVVIFNTLHTPPPPLRDDHPDVPAELEAICLKMLSKKPEDRYASCRELAKDLGKWLAGRPTSLEIPAMRAQLATAGVEVGAGPAISPGSGERLSGDQTSVPLDQATAPRGRGRLLGWVRGNRAITSLAACLLISTILVGAWLVTSRTKTDPISSKVAAGGPKGDDQSTPATTIPDTVKPPVTPVAGQPADKAPERKKAVASLASNGNVPTAADRVKATAKSPEKSTLPASAASAKAEAKPDPLLKLPYGDRVQAAYEACLANQGDRARVILASCPAELRGWEWYYCQRLSRGGMITIPGEAGAVRTFEFSPDGKLIVFSGALALRILDGQQQKKLGDHKDVVGLGFSSDGKRVRSLDADNRVKEWDVASGSLVRSFELAFPSPRCHAISHDARWVAAGNRSGTIKVWDASTQAEVSNRQLGQSIRNLAFSADGSRVIAAVRDGVCVLDWRDKKAKLAVRKLGSPPSMAMSPEGRSLAGAAGNGVRIWDLSTNTTKHALAGHEGGVRSVVYSDDGERLATGGFDRTVQVWDATSGRLVGSYQGHTGEVTCIRFSPGGHSIAASSRDGSLCIWKIREEHSEKVLDLGFPGWYVPHGFTSPGNGKRIFTFPGDGKRISLLLGEKALALFDSSSLLTVARYSDLLGVSPRLDKIAQVISGRIIIKDPRNGATLGECNFDPSLFGFHPPTEGWPDQPELICLENDTYFFKFAGLRTYTTAEGTRRNDKHTCVGVWDNTKGGPLWFDVGGAERGTALGWDFTHATLLPRSGNVIGVHVNIRVDPTQKIMDVINILDVHTGEALAGFPGDSFTIHPNGDLLAVVADRAIEIRSLQKNRSIARFNGEECSFDPSGRLVAIRNKRTTAICELSTERKVFEFQPQSTVAFSPDGRRLVASQGNNVLILDPLTGKILLKLRGGSDNFAFSPDGRIITSVKKNLARFWVADRPSPGPDGS